MAVKYSGILRFADEIKAEIDLAADGAVEKAVIINGDGVETPIGGGTSDFTTAEVTITNNTENSIFLMLPVVEDDLNQTFLNASASVGSNESKSITVALYKGKAQCVADDLAYPVCTGDVENAGHGTFIITGDGAITNNATAS